MNEWTSAVVIGDRHFTAIATQFYRDRLLISSRTYAFRKSKP
ncbi:MAG: hypothetical protein ACRC8Y_18820 [Chroococcales cyanobacterium]